MNSCFLQLTAINILKVFFLGHQLRQIDYSEVRNDKFGHLALWPILTSILDAGIACVVMTSFDSICIFIFFFSGPHKPGSVRRMIGSPRQLENAVPTSKNPHGVWV